jgi:hypothetical protein
VRGAPGGRVCPLLAAGGGWLHGRAAAGRQVRRGGGRGGSDPVSPDRGGLQAARTRGEARVGRYVSRGAAEWPVTGCQGRPVGDYLNLIILQAGREST